MTRKRIHDPALAEQQRQDRLARQAEIARLKAQGAEVNVDKRSGQIMAAYRPTVFRILLRAGTITQGHYDAAERLIVLWAKANGLEGGKEPSLEVVQGSGELEAPETALLAAARRVVAVRRLDATLDQLGPCDRALLKALMVATVETDRPKRWQLTVQEVTGVTQAVRQSQMVVAALENLRRVFEDPRERAA